jgi:apolipoprotein N-acyltransferase
MIAKIPRFPAGPKTKKTLLAVFSGLAAFAAFPPFDVSVMAWFALVPIFYLAGRCGYKEAFWYSYLAGVVFWGSVLYWLTVVSVPGFIILVLVLAVFHGFFGMISRMSFKYSMNFFVIPFSWVVLEYIRANLFTGFPWALLGHSQYRNLNIIQIADITGAYGVSFIIVTFNFALYSWISGAKKKTAHVMTALLVIICSTSYGIYRMGDTPVGEGAKISVVQGNISQALKWEARSAETIIERYSALTRAAAKGDPDIIIWPETAYPYLMDQEDLSATQMERLAFETGIPVLAGIVYEDAGEYYNSAALFRGDGGSAQIYKKIHLVPFGEYVPFEKYLEPLRNYINKPIGDFVPGKEYKLFSFVSVTSSEGPDSSIIRRTVFHKMGVMICFEDVFPYVARNFVLEGARILVNITNDAWFGDTAASRQHLQSSVFRAVENRVPVVRAANTGISCFIDRTGKVLSQVKADGRETFVSGYDTCYVTTTPGKSYYTSRGDMFVYFSGILLVLLAAFGFFGSRACIDRK